MGKAAKIELEFVKKEKESNDAYSFYFKRSKNFEFFCGQYLKLFLDITNSDERGSSRYFTISSSPKDNEYLTITTRIIKSSFKLRFSKLKAGEKVQAFGPIGYFDFDQNLYRSHIFITGGIGITPVRSILGSINLKNLNNNFYIFNSYDYLENIIFKDEFLNYEIKNSRVKIIYSLTKEEKEISGFEKGRITIDLLKKYISNFEETKFYLTGSELMVNEIYDKLIKINISEVNIFKEDFPGY